MQTTRAMSDIWRNCLYRDGAGHDKSCRRSLQLQVADVGIFISAILLLMVYRRAPPDPIFKPQGGHASHDDRPE